MSETLSQDPDGLGVAYTTLAPSYPPTPATPSSTVQDVPPGANLPPFSTFSSDMDSSGTFSSVSERLFSDTRLLDISNWDYYTEARLLDRTENGLSIISSQPQYRPWESKPVDSTSAYASTTQVNTFADAFAQQNSSKLPSFQSQFQAFNDPVTTTEPTLTTLTNLTPVSPNSSPGSHSLTTLNTNFHTLSAVNPRSYPLVPAPIQAREIPSIQQQFIDERHIQLYSHPTANLTTLNNTIHSASIFPAQNGAIIQNNQLIASPTVVTVLKSEPDLKLTSNLASLQDSNLKLQNVGLHHSQFQNPMTALGTDNSLYNGLDKKINGMNTNIGSPTRNDFRKKERRKIRASSLESSAESDGASSNMEIASENSGQVAAISSTAGFKSHHAMNVNSSMDIDEISGGNVDKQVKKKRKRCGECIGCQRKDNCGDCAPCRNDKSHQICKQRRCEKLTEKKNLYGEASYLRGESRRGRGKGRGGGSYRGRKPSGPVAPLASGGVVPSDSNDGVSVGPNQPQSRPSPQPQTPATVHMLKPDQQPMPVQQQPMAPMPFYADPNRFPTPVWQADPAQGWPPQGQFIQQIPAAGQPTIEGYQQYPNGIYQATYQQPAYEANTFYTGAVQVLTNARPPSAPEPQVQLTPRGNSNYSHSPSPISASNNTTNRQYEYSIQNQNFIPPSTTPTGNTENSQTGNASRPSSVNSVVNPPTPNQNFSQQNNSGFTTVSTASFSPNSNQSVNYVNANSGNAEPGYPPVNSSPQLVSHNSSGYPGSGRHYSGGNHENPWQSENQVIWESPHENSENVKLEQHYNEQQMQEHQNGTYMQGNKSASENREQGHTEVQTNVKTFSQAEKVNLNSRIKTMILNKQQAEGKLEEAKQVEQQNNAGHFLWYSRHPHLISASGDGGSSFSKCIKTDPVQKLYQVASKEEDVERHKNSQYSTNFAKFSANETSIYFEQGFQKPNTMNYVERTKLKSQLPLEYPCKLIITNGKQQKNNTSETILSERSNKNSTENSNKKIGCDIPQCSCFPQGHFPPEPGTYYTHLGCAKNLKNLRHDLECRTGSSGEAIRIEKIHYTGKEGKTAQGCPVAKWIIRRSSSVEKYLIIVKHRKGHMCHSAFIVVCIVVWDGIKRSTSDELYSLLTDKLNQFGLPTKRRCATNEPRTCACQGLNPDTCGASFSFGCSWSMYYNGCKFTRSKEVRKFRLNVKSEEQLIENKLQTMANTLSPMYKCLAPRSFENQCIFEGVASDCRLGSDPGRPFSGVTVCMDFCAHSHKDLQNMNNGCTVVVTLTKYRDTIKPDDEQLHVLPLYVMDETDEFDSRDNQNDKIRNGCIEVLQRYDTEIRTHPVPAETGLRNKNRKAPDQNKIINKKNCKTQSYASAVNSTPKMANSSTDYFYYQDSDIQSGQVSSTVLDYPINQTMRYDTFFNNTSKNSSFHASRSVSSLSFIGRNAYPALPDFSFFKTPLHSFSSTLHMNSYSYKNCYPLNGCVNNAYDSIPSNYNEDLFVKWSNVYPYANTNSYNILPVSCNSPTFESNSPYQIKNPFDDSSPFSYNTLPLNAPKTNQLHDIFTDTKKIIDISYTDNAECFKDNEIGGVAIALQHGSVLFECAKHELHATTALKRPDRQSPTRISLVFYQHRNLNKCQHGLDDYTEKMRRKVELNSTSFEINSKLENGMDIFRKVSNTVVRSPSLPNAMPFTKIFPMYPCIVTGPSQDLVSGTLEEQKPSHVVSSNNYCHF